MKFLLSSLEHYNRNIITYEYGLVYTVYGLLGVPGTITMFICFTSCSRYRLRHPYSIFVCPVGCYNSSFLNGDMNVD